MTDKTISEEELSREEAAARLESLASELREGKANVEVGNKTVSLSPAPTLAYEISARESSSILRGNRESVNVKIGWKPETE